MTAAGVALLGLRILAFGAGAATVIATLSSSLRTVVLPRAVPARLARFVFQTARLFFELYAGRSATYEARDRVLAVYGPVALFWLLLTWLTLVLIGFTAMFWAVEGGSLEHAFQLSGSSMLTLGSAVPAGLPGTLLVYGAASLGLVELALLITYLPSMYSAFQRREALVTMLEVRAGSPPSGVVMLERFARLGRLELLTEEVWTRWEEWFVLLEESHTSLPALNFFRSPQPSRHWVVAAGAVLDAGSLYASSLDIDHDIRADLCIRAGYLAFRHIATFFRIPYDPDPGPDDPIAVSREEFEEACDRLAAAGLPVKSDRDQAWRDFAGWRVNYDRVLLALCGLTAPPPAPWSSDRATPRWRRPLLFGRRRAI